MQNWAFANLHTSFMIDLPLTFTQMKSKYSIQLYIKINWKHIYLNTVYVCKYSTNLGKCSCHHFHFIVWLWKQKPWKSMFFLSCSVAPEWDGVEAWHWMWQCEFFSRLSSLEKVHSVSSWVNVVDTFMCISYLLYIIYWIWLLCISRRKWKSMTCLLSVKPKIFRANGGLWSDRGHMSCSMEVITRKMVKHIISTPMHSNLYSYFILIPICLSKYSQYVYL